MTPEGRVKEKIKKLLKIMNIWYFMPAANGYGKAGIPDFVCCVKGGFVAIEAKSVDGELQPLQALTQAHIQQGGGFVWVQYGEDTTNLEAHLRMLI